jgi:hypothetical protein
VLLLQPHSHCQAPPPPTAVFAQVHRRLWGSRDWRARAVEQSGVRQTCRPADPADAGFGLFPHENGAISLPFIHKLAGRYEQLWRRRGRPLGRPHWKQNPASPRHPTPAATAVLHMYKSCRILG